MERPGSSSPVNNAENLVGGSSQPIDPHSQRQRPSAPLTSPGRPSAVPMDGSGAYDSRGSIRGVFGYGTSRISDFVNDNLIAVRLVATASIASLALYGISYTPLFFRFRNVSQVPSKYFVDRRKLSCRIMNVDRDEKSSIILWVRHLSPVERLCFSRSFFEWFVSVQPSSLVKRHPMDQDPSQLIKVRVAGVRWPPYQWEDGWLDRMVAEKIPVKCECLARMVPEASDHAAHNAGLWENDSASTNTAGPIQLGPAERKKRPIPGIGVDSNALIAQMSTFPRQGAICRVFFREREGSLARRLFGSTDLALSMVRSGRAVANDAPLASPMEGFRSMDASDTVDDLQRDAAYVDELSRAEHRAAQGFHGIWSDAAYRESRADVIEEADFQANATLFRKIWRWIRGG